jgi:Na+/H+ antiporter NhaD/arsenite permease-like protein
MTKDKKDALKMTLGGMAAYVLVPIVWAILFDDKNNVGINEVIGKNIIVAIFGFPIMYFFILKFNKQRQLNSMVAKHNKNNPAAIDRKIKLSKIALIIGLFMLIFLFLPQAINGTLAKQYYLGALFWIVVVVVSANNIFNKK